MGGNNGLSKYIDTFDILGTRSSAKAAKKQVDDVNIANAKAISDAKAAVEGASEQASATVSSRKRAMARSQSVFTSPLGIGEQAGIAKKTLLGA